MLLALELLAIRHWNVAVGTEGAIFLLPCALSGCSLGTALAVLVARRHPTRLPQACSAAAILFALSVPWQFLPRVALVINEATHSVPSHRVQVAFAVETLFAAGLCYTLWGCVVGLVFRQPQGRTSTLYGISLFGSAAGGLLATLLLSFVDRSHATAVVAALCVAGVVPFLCWSGPLPNLHPALVGGALATWCVALLAWLPSRAVAHLPMPDTIWTAENAMSQIEVYKSAPIHVPRRADANVPKGAWLSDAIRPPVGVDVLGLVLDNRPWFSMVVRYDSLRHCDFLRHEMGFHAFELGRPARALVLGPGGGRDVLEGVVAGCPSITAVDVNPLMFRAARETGSHVYDEAGVHTVVAEGRTFLRRYQGPPFDLVLLPYVKKYGSYGIGKDYILTTQGLRLALGVLKSDGILTIRDEYDFRSLYCRTMLDALPASERRHPENFRQLRDAGAWMLLYSPAGFRGERAARLAGMRDKDGVDVLPLRFKKRQLPRDDDQPYLGGPDPHLLSQFDHLVVVPAAGALVIAMFLLLLVRARRQVAAATDASTREGRLLALGLYFSGLGIGFAIVEISLLEKLTLYVGHPIVSTPMVLCALLVSCGIGSMWLGRVHGMPDRSLLVKRALAATIAVGTGLAIATQAAARPAANDTQAILVCAGLLIVMGIPMGSLFPLGLAAAESTRGDLVLWMYSVNGIAAAVGGAIVRLVVQNSGFRLTMALGVAAYLLSAIAISLVHHRPPSEARTGTEDAWLPSPIGDR